MPEAIIAVAESRRRETRAFWRGVLAGAAAGIAALIVAAGIGLAFLSALLPVVPQ